MNPFKDDISEQPRVVLIDGDVSIHKVSRGCEHQVRWDNGLWSWFASEDDAIFGLDMHIEKIKRLSKCSEVVITLSSETNFRHGVYEQYKYSRNNPDAYPPILKGFLREYFHDNFTVFEIPDLEADDVLGILMTCKSYKPGYQKVLATIDKDLDTVPGEHFNMNREELYDVTLDQADYFFYQQILMGDKTDDIPGCPGFGPVAAKKLLDKTPREKWWEAITDAYIKKGFDEEYALMNARLVRILRIEEWKEKKVNLWLPQILEKDQ